ncbi:reverse transcriptase domain-containing protein [Tanacetum coccineum]|uniref:Reverse transcriptase domain-containing protein n=1 Tax=Tanacetum coccineum TaxID=301880 RepID=A0ABQ4XRL4_9ASTR
MISMTLRLAFPPWRGCEEEMTLEEVDGQMVGKVKTKIIAKDGTITKVPEKFKSYETFFERRKDRKRQEDVILRNEAERDGSGTRTLCLMPSSKPVWEKNNKDDRGYASLSFVHVSPSSCHVLSCLAFVGVWEHIRDVIFRMLILRGSTTVKGSIYNYGGLHAFTWPQHSGLQIVLYCLMKIICYIILENVPNTTNVVLAVAPTTKIPTLTVIAQQTTKPSSLKSRWESFKTRWNTNAKARGHVAALAMSWNDFKALMVEEFCPSNEMEKLENEFWNHKMVGANHAAYTDRFHELAKLVPHLVTPETSRIKRYIAGLAPEIRGMLRATQPDTIQTAILRAGILTDEAVSCGTLTKGSEKRKGVEEPSKTGGSWKDNKKAKRGTGFVATAPFRNEVTELSTPWHSGDINYPTDVNVDYLHQPWRAFATKAPKPKYVRKKSDLDTSPKKKTVQATEGTRLKSKAKVAKSNKKKQSTKMPKAKGLNVLSEVALTEAEQMKFSTKRFKT